MSLSCPVNSYIIALHCFLISYHFLFLVPPLSPQTSVVYFGAGHIRATHENQSSPLTPLWGYTDDGTGLEEQVFECTVTSVRFVKSGPTIPRHNPLQDTLMDPSSTDVSVWISEKEISAAESLLIDESTPFGSAFALIDLSIITPTIPIAHPAPTLLPPRTPLLRLNRLAARVIEALYHSQRNAPFSLPVSCN